MGTIQEAFLASFRIQVAMWADEEGFGSDFEDKAEYEDLCETFSEEIAQAAYDTLSERPCW
jgi:hypothetical protein